MDGAEPRVTRNELLPPPLGRSTTTVTVAPGTYERIRTIADTRSVIFTPSIERMIEPAVIDVQETLDGLEERTERAGKQARGFFSRLFRRG
mgnify:CR=1 FL=1